MPKLSIPEQSMAVTKIKEESPVVNKQTNRSSCIKKIPNSDHTSELNDQSICSTNCQRSIDCLDHPDTDQMVELAILNFKNGHFETALHNFQKVLKVDRNNKLARYYIGFVYEKLASKFNSEGKEKESICYARDVAKYKRGFFETSFNVRNHINDLYDTISSFKNNISGLKRTHEFIFITCTPKSGSTYLYNLLQILSGYKKVTLQYNSTSPSCFSYEHNLHLPYLIKCANDRTISKAHVKGSLPNLELMRSFRIKPIILTRNIFDSLVSQKDMMLSGELFGTEIANFVDLEEKKRKDYLIDIVATWYFEFYESWFDACNRKLIDAMWITYEEFIDNKEVVLQDLCEWYGFKKSKDEILKAIKRGKGRDNRFNIGKMGRGLRYFNKDHKKRIEAKKGLYPRVDFRKFFSEPNRPKNLIGFDQWKSDTIFRNASIDDYRQTKINHPPLTSPLQVRAKYSPHKHPYPYPGTELSYRSSSDTETAPDSTSFGVKKPNFFIFGCERSGTTLLGALLTTHPDVFVLNDGFIFQLYAEYQRRVKSNESDLRQALMSDYVLPQNELKQYLSVLISRYMQPLPGQSELTWLKHYAEVLDPQSILEETKEKAFPLRSVFDLIYFRLVPINYRGRKVFGEKTPIHTFWASWIGTLYPNSKIVTIVRNPITNVASIYRRMQPKCLETAIRMYLNYYENRLRFLYDETNSMIIRYEDLIKSPKNVVSSIYDYLEIHVDKENIPTTFNY